MSENNVVNEVIELGKSVLNQPVGPVSAAQLGGALLVLGGLYWMAKTVGSLVGVNLG